jgi:hypothetical protein
MALYYQLRLGRKPGAANNVVLLNALLSMLRATPAPGIAGINLPWASRSTPTLIYDASARLRNGVTPQAAIRAGFDKAFSAIFDSNVTAFIAGLVLWVIGRGAIRGCGGADLGILTSMFTSLSSRALITLMYGGRRGQPSRSVKEQAKWNSSRKPRAFLSYDEAWYGLSVLVIISIGSFFVRGLNLAVDFTGGVQVQASSATR